MAKSDNRITLNDEEEEWTTRPAEYHSVVLENGKTLRVDFHFDKDRIALETIKPVTDLNDLCTFFTRITTHELYDCDEITVVELEIEDGVLIRRLDDDKESIRFRFGALLAYHLNESRVVLQGSRKLAETADLTVKLRLRNNDLATEERSNAGKPLWRNFGSRGIAATTPEPCRRLILSEITALFSDYFFSLFYRGYKESKDEWITMQDVKPEIISDILRLFVGTKDSLCINSDYKSGKQVELSWMLDLIDHCDRFMFIRQLPRVMQAAKMMIYKLHEFDCDEYTVWHVQQMTAILRSNELMQAFARKFCIKECLNEWESRFAHILSPEFTAALAERRLQLPGRRSQMTIEYEQGEIVCSLFDDLHPQLIEDLHAMGKEGKQLRGGLLEGLPAVLPPRKLRTDEVECSAIFEQRKLESVRYHYLMYFDEINGDKPYIAICNYQYNNGWLMGYVFSGAELITGNRGKLVNCIVERP